MPGCLRVDASMNSTCSEVAQCRLRYLGCALFTRSAIRVYVVYLQARSVFAIYLCETCTFNETFCEFLINSIAAHVGKGNGKH